MTVIRAGTIALIAFILGDFATAILNLGEFSPSIYAAATITILTALNILGTRHSSSTQNVLASTVVLALVAISIPGLFITPADDSGLAIAD